METGPKTARNGDRDGPQPLADGQSTGADMITSPPRPFLSP